MHTLDSGDGMGYLKDEGGIGYRSITRCCPEGIRITDNAIIPLKERVVDRHYDPLRKLVQLVTGRRKG
jgi:succinate dehydrogenase / fumarate reductase, iron-sulfur subunit